MPIITIEITPQSYEKKAEIAANMNAMEDAATGGLAEYTRRANAAEESI